MSFLSPEKSAEIQLAISQGGTAALTLCPGQSAVLCMILNLAEAGDNIVSSSDLCRGTKIIFTRTLLKLGIEVRFADAATPDSFARATDSRTRAYFAETLLNTTLDKFPMVDVFPIADVARIGGTFGIPLIVDNTAVPDVVHPLDQGAAIIVYSTLTDIDGWSGRESGAIILDSGFSWEQSKGRFPMLTGPDLGYHPTAEIEALEPLDPIAHVLWTRLIAMRDMGADR